MDTHLPLFSIVLKIAEFQGSTLFHWDRKYCKLLLVNNYKTLKTKLLFYRAFVVILIAGEIYELYTSVNFNFTRHLLYVITMFVTLSFYSFITTLQNSAKCICSYINGLYQMINLSFEPGTVVYKNSFISSINVYSAYMSFIATINVPILFVYGVHALTPCMPSLGGYLLIPSCNTFTETLLPLYLQSGTIDYIVRLVVCLGNHLFWSFGESTGGIVCTNIMVLCIVSFARSIKRLVGFFKCQ